MTFRTDAQSDIANIINDTDSFGIAAVYTPPAGTPTVSFNCLIGESIKHGNDETGIINAESISITVVSSDVTAVVYRGTITIDSVDYEVVGDPYQDSDFSATSVIDLRRDRLNETKI